MEKYLKWKISFWILLVLFILVSVVLIYMVIDQSVTITYMSEGYKDTKESLESLMYIIPEISRNLTRDEVTNILKDKFPDDYLFKEGKIYISNLTFEFNEQGKLISITR